MQKANLIMSNIVKNIESVIIGKKHAIELVVIALACDGHVLIEDVPGVGKTTMVFSLAKSIDASFKRIQFTPDIMPSDITGFSMYNPKMNEFVYQQGSVFSNIILADEINRTPPKTQASLLEVMEEKQITVDGTTHKLPNPFMVLATQNPVEYVGTYPLPEAQLDRFLLRVTLGYPDSEAETLMLKTHEKGAPINNLTSVVDISDVIHMQEQVRNVFIDEKLKQYIVSLANATRNVPSILLGASPRAALNLMLTSKALALYEERNFVTPEDIQAMLPYTWGHRMLLTQDAKLKNLTPYAVLKQVMQNVKVPVVEK